LFASLPPKLCVHMRVDYYLDSFFVFLHVCIGRKKIKIVSRERLYLLSRNHFFHLPSSNKLVKNLEERISKFRYRFSLLLSTPAVLGISFDLCFRRIFVSDLRLRLFRRKMVSVEKYFQGNHFPKNVFRRKHFTLFTARMKNQFFFLHILI
jgi:hypothetical protein